MDRLNWMEKAKQILGKYRYVLLIFVIGLVLMLLPGKQTQTQNPTATQPQQDNVDIRQELSDILSKIQGAGRVEVMLTVYSGEEVLYQYDEDIASGENGTVRRETVIITDADRAQNGLIRQVMSPVYQGAIIVCDGADSATVRLSIMEAVSKATGLGTDRISVLKMK